jgi:hypothetical protein
MLARIGSDDPASRLWALAATLAGTAVASLRAHVHANASRAE